GRAARPGRTERRRWVGVRAAPEPAKPADAAPVAPSATPAQATPAGGESVKPAPTIEPPKPVAPRTRLSDQPVKRNGQIAVFVSRKEKKTFVRQGFIPIFEMPITIDIPDHPRSTHVLTARSFTDK